MFRENEDFCISVFPDGTVLNQIDLLKSRLVDIYKAGSLTTKKVEVHRKNGTVFWRNQKVRDAIADHLHENTSHNLDKSLKKGLTAKEIHDHIHSHGNLKRQVQGSPTNNIEHTRKQLDAMVKSGHAEKHKGANGEVHYSRNALSKPRKTYEYKVKATGGQHSNNREHLHHTIQSSKRLSPEELHAQVMQGFSEKGGLKTKGGKDNNHNLGYQVYHDGNLIQHHNVRGKGGELKHQPQKEAIPVDDKGTTAKAEVKGKSGKSKKRAGINGVLDKAFEGNKIATKKKSPKVAKSGIYDSFDEFLGDGNDVDLDDNSNGLQFVEYNFPGIDD
jgi:hypothetical protein